MTDKDPSTVIIVILVVFIVGLVISPILNEIFSVVMVIASVGLLYLAWRLVRAAERIADALERQQMAESHSETVSEDRM